MKKIFFLILLTGLIASGISIASAGENCKDASGNFMCKPWQACAYTDDDYDSKKMACSNLRSDVKSNGVETVRADCVEDGIGCSYGTEARGSARAGFCKGGACWEQDILGEEHYSVNEGGSRCKPIAEDPVDDSLPYKGSTTYKRLSGKYGYTDGRNCMLYQTSGSPARTGTARTSGSVELYYFYDDCKKLWLNHDSLETPPISIPSFTLSETCDKCGVSVNDFMKTTGRCAFSDNSFGKKIDKKWSIGGWIWFDPKVGSVGCYDIISVSKESKQYLTGGTVQLKNANGEVIDSTPEVLIYNPYVRGCPAGSDGQICERAFSSIIKRGVCECQQCMINNICRGEMIPDGGFCTSIPAKERLRCMSSYQYKPEAKKIDGQCQQGTANCYFDEESKTCKAQTGSGDSMDCSSCIAPVFASCQNKELPCPTNVDKSSLYPYFDKAFSEELKAREINPEFHQGNMNPFDDISVAFEIPYCATPKTRSILGQFVFKLSEQLDRDRDGRVDAAFSGMNQLSSTDGCKSLNNWCDHTDLNHDGYRNNIDTFLFGAKIAGKCTEKNDWCGYSELTWARGMPFDVSKLDKSKSLVDVYSTKFDGWEGGIFESLPDYFKQYLYENLGAVSFRIRVTSSGGADNCVKEKYFPMPLSNIVDVWGNGGLRIAYQSGRGLSASEMISKSYGIVTEGFNKIQPYAKYKSQFSHYYNLISYPDEDVNDNNAGGAITTSQAMDYAAIKGTSVQQMVDYVIKFVYTKRVTSSYSAGKIAFVTPGIAPAYAIHESGHTLAGLSDEFLSYKLTGSESEKNCVANSFVWGKYGDKNWNDPGCGNHPLYYRPSENSIMKSSSEFNVVSCGYILDALVPVDFATGLRIRKVLDAYRNECCKLKGVIQPSAGC